MYGVWLRSPRGAAGSEPLPRVQLPTSPIHVEPLQVSERVTGPQTTVRWSPSRFRSAPGGAFTSGHPTTETRTGTRRVVECVGVGERVNSTIVPVHTQGDLGVNLHNGNRQCSSLDTFLPDSDLVSPFAVDFCISLSIEVWTAVAEHNTDVSSFKTR